MLTKKSPVIGFYSWMQVTKQWTLALVLFFGQTEIVPACESDLDSGVPFHFRYEAAEWNRTDFFSHRSGSRTELWPELTFYVPIRTDAPIMEALGEFPAGSLRVERREGFPVGHLVRIAVEPGSESLKRLRYLVYLLKENRHMLSRSLLDKARTIAMEDIPNDAIQQDENEDL